MTLEYKQNAIIHDDQSRIQAHHLILKGSDFEIGKKLGELATKHGIEKKPVDDPVRVKAQKRYLERNYPIWLERMAGFAEGIGADFDDDRIDFSCFGIPLGEAGCSAIYFPPANTKFHHGILSRNLDFPLPVEAEQSPGAPFSNTCVLELHPESGYSSISIFCFELFGQPMEGINSEGLVVVHLADQTTANLFPNEATGQAAVGLNEFLPIQLLLDTCATVEEAKETLLLNKHYYRSVPVHLLIADRFGNSFVWESSSARNQEFILENSEQPQIVTNYLLHRFPDFDSFPEESEERDDPFNRYKRLHNAVEEQPSALSEEEIQVVAREAEFKSPAANGVITRTLMHNLYNQQRKTLKISFYVNEQRSTEESPQIQRSKYFQFQLSDKTSIQ